MALRFGGAFAVQFWRCYSRYWSCPGWTICRIAVCAGTDFSVGRMDCHQSERSSYIGTQMVVTFALATLKTFLARCTTWWKFAIAPWVYHWYRGVRGDLHLCLA